jgi:predicted nucleotide-binding protein
MFVVPPLGHSIPSHFGFLCVQDLGSTTELKPRARQNVVLELGYFLAKLGRSRVCALYKGNVELPSDYDGVIYLKMDSHWQIDLAKEIRQVIKDIDLNKVLA